MWKGENDDEFGYSIAEKLKLKTSESQKKLHIKFGDSDDESHDLKISQVKPDTGEQRKSSYTKGNKKKEFDTYGNNKFCKFKSNKKQFDTYNDDKLSQFKGKKFNSDAQTTFKSSNTNYAVNKKHVTFDHESDANNEDSDSESEYDDSGSEVSNRDLENNESDIDNSENENETTDYSNMTMQELLSLQEKIGTRAFNKKVLKVEKTVKYSEIKNSYKRLNKNRPSEMPLMRKTAPRLKYAVLGKKVKEAIKRDPRFDDLSGNLNMTLWDKNYSFLKDARRKEMEVLRKQYTLVKNEKQKSTLKLALQRLENQDRESKRREQEKLIKKLERNQQREALREGKKPKFMSNKTKKDLLKTKQFEDLKAAHKVDKYLERKEKKLLQRERKRDL